MSGGCGFCEVEGWEKDVAGMEEPATDNPKENEELNERSAVDFFKFTCDILGYDPYDRIRKKNQF